MGDDYLVGFLDGVLLDGKIDADELKVLNKLMDKKKLKSLLNRIGHTNVTLNRAIKKGGDELGGSMEIHYEALEEGIIVLPRPRQRTIQPNIQIIREKEGKTSWTELFYDLMFVGIINILAHSNADLNVFIVLFTSIWRIWNETLNYSSRYDMHDLLHKFFYYWEIVCLLFMGMNLKSVINGSIKYYAISFIIAHIPLLTQYIILLRLPGKQHIIIWIIILFITMSPWAISIFYPEHHLLLWSAAMIFSEVYIFIHNMYTKIPINAKHWVERRGLFIIIVLGEFIAGIIIDMEEFVLEEYIKSAVKVIIIFSIKWLYFDTDKIEKHAIRKRSFVQSLWSLLHLPIALSIAMLSIHKIPINYNISIILIIMTIHSLLMSHKKYKVPKYLRFVIRSIVIISLPIINTFNDSIYITGGMVLSLALFEIIVTSNLKLFVL